MSFMLRLKDDFEHHFTLSDLENMIPYERSIYLILIQQRLIEHDNNKGS